MHSVFVVIGNGPNGLEIPLSIHKTQADAQALVDSIPHDEEGWLDSDFSECNGIYIDEDNFEQSEVGKPLYAKLFKDGNYYAGCGGCYKLEVKEFAFGEPMVSWDLD